MNFAKYGERLSSMLTSYALTANIEDWAGGID